MVKKIPLQNGMFALVDKEDYERCNEHLWIISTKDNKSSLRVFKNTSNGIVTLGRFILGLNKSDDCFVSFKDKNPLNHKRNNLIKTDRQAVVRNKKGHRGTSSKYKGVSWAKNQGKWKAYISIEGKRRHLGYFVNEDNAAEAYNKAAFNNWGEDCFLNVLGKNNNADTHELSKRSVHRDSGKFTSEFLGVSKASNERGWEANISSEKKRHFIGRYPTELEAAKAYDKKAKELHGDKAILNFPE